MTSAAPSIESAAATWDAIVEGNARGSYLQLSAWAGVKAVNGWSARRVVLPGEASGVQVLLRRPGPLPWAFAYAPRGPVLERWDDATVERLTAAIRGGLRGAQRISHLRIDPEVELGGPDDLDGATRSALRSAGWRPAPSIQPPSSRIVDLRADEAALWSGLRKKWRQYVNKARAGGVSVVNGTGEQLEEFHAIYQETAKRAGFHIRTLSAYRDVWNGFAPAGRARLLFARDAQGAGLATLFLVSCGTRVVEPYGGMTAVGADSRANYLLKWEAIRSSRDAGATSYDMWGEVTAGIGHFKAGFGGRQVTYVGGWDLVLDPVGRTTWMLAQRANVWLARRRLGRAATTDEGGVGAPGDAA